MTTDEVLGVDGSSIQDHFLITKRNKMRGDVKLTAKRLPLERIFIITPDNHPDYLDAAPGEREYGYICDNEGLMQDGTKGYNIW